MDVSFSPFRLEHGLLSDMRSDKFPTLLSAWKNDVLNLPEGATHFGYVHEGVAELTCNAGKFMLSPGLYFSLNGAGSVSGSRDSSSGGIVVTAPGYKGFFQIGGPVEPWGRLNYIDGCTDSLLIPPILMGDPCMNLLCFPPGINQTSHTHPSMRVGMVISGTGKCITVDGVVDLFPGQVFVIHAHKAHSFATQDEAMRVIAYHPDSDFGATHEDHPMINRTIVNGVSAALIDEIRTGMGVISQGKRQANGR